MTKEEYWEESVASSLEEAGVVVTAEQIKAIADDMEISHDQHDMAYGLDVASSNLSASKEQELSALREELRSERDKVQCRACNGRGHITVNGPSHSATSTCGKCRGYGRHSP